MALPVLLAVFGVAIYGRAVGFQFVPWDDDIAVTGNPYIRQLTASTIGWMFTDVKLSLRYEPLTYLMWALVHQCLGLAAWAFHALNLICHVANIVLAFFLIRVVLLRWRDRFDAPSDERKICGAAAIGAAVWGFHPLRAEVAGWVTQSCFAESTCFALVSLLFYFAAVRGAPVSLWRVPAFWGALFFFTVSLVFFPVAVGFAVLLPVLDLYLFRRALAGEKPLAALRRLMVEKAPFFAVAFLVGVLTIYGRVTSGGTWSASKGLGEFTLAQRFVQAAYVFDYYLWKPFDFLHCSPVYTTLLEVNPVAPRFVVSLVALLLISAVVFYFRRRLPWLFMLWIAHLLLLFPVGGYFDHPHYASDRYAYLQGILWGIAAAGGILWLWNHGTSFLKPAVTAALLVLLVLLARLTAAQMNVWTNGESLFKHALAELGDDPYRVDIHWRLGNYYMDQQRWVDAVQSFDNALAPNPEYPKALRQRGLALLGLAESEEVARLPEDRRQFFYAEAAANLDSAFRLEPTAAASFSAAYAYTQLRQFEKAESRLKDAASIDPANRVLLMRLARLYFAEGKRDLALGLLQGMTSRPAFGPINPDALMRDWATSPDPWVRPVSPPTSTRQ